MRQTLIVFLVILTDADPDGAHKETFISLLSQKQLIKEGPMTLALCGNEDAEIVSAVSQSILDLPFRLECSIPISIINLEQMQCR